MAGDKKSGRCLVVEYSDGREPNYLLIKLTPDGHPLPPYNGSTINVSGGKWIAAITQPQASAISERAAKRMDFANLPQPIKRTLQESESSSTSIISFQAITYRFDENGALQWVKSEPIYTRGTSEFELAAPPKGTIIAIVPFSAPVEPRTAFGRRASSLLAPVTLAVDLTVGVPYAIGYCVYYYFADPRKLILV